MHFAGRGDPFAVLPGERRLTVAEPFAERVPQFLFEPREQLFCLVEGSVERLRLLSQRRKSTRSVPIPPSPVTDRSRNVTLTTRARVIEW